MPPTCLARCCSPACAISGYESGDLYDGIFTGSALIACLLQTFCGCVGGLYALLVWQPNPKKIRGDGTQRTVNNPCCSAICVGAPCTIAFWENGDSCTGCCQGDACIALIIGIVAEIFGIPCVDVCYVACCWTPNPINFKTHAGMDGGGVPAPSQHAPLVAGAIVVGAKIAS